LTSLVVQYPPLPSISIDSFPEVVGPSQQPRIQLSLASPYPLPLTGKLILNYESSTASPADDPAVQFSTGGRSVVFRIPANSLQAEFPVAQFAVQCGTIAASITLTVDSLSAGATTATGSPTSRTARVLPVAPVLRSVEVSRVAGGFRVQVIGVTTTRELKEARLRFVPRPGSDLITTETTVSLESVSTTWFQTPGSVLYGGQFLLTLPFTFQGSSDVLDSVIVSLVNASGTSTEMRGVY
jgi:hypothetical protein